MIDSFPLLIAAAMVLLLIGVVNAFTMLSGHLSGLINMLSWLCYYYLFIKAVGAAAHGYMLEATLIAFVIFLMSQCVAMYIRWLRIK